MPQKIPWSEPEIDNNELKEVLDSFESGWLTMGPKVKKFERVMADFVGASHVPNIKGKLFLARYICKIETNPNIIPDTIK